MATKKAGGTAKNLRDSNPKYLGIKHQDGERVKTGVIIVRQRGTLILPGKNVYIGKDHTIHASKDGVVSFRTIRKYNFTGKHFPKKEISII